MTVDLSAVQMVASMGTVMAEYLDLKTEMMKAEKWAFVMVERRAPSTVVSLVVNWDYKTAGELANLKAAEMEARKDLRTVELKVESMAVLKAAWKALRMVAQ
jgi:hypothetical protein